MQHIGLRRESETGAMLADFGLDGIDVRIVKQAPASSACLRFIDPYGDTIFNRLQIPVLLDELGKLKEATSDTGLRRNIEQVVKFIQAALEDVHIYVRFIGD